MRIRPFILMLAAFVWISIGIQAQVRVSGKVKDENGEVIPYTTVRLKDTSIGCTTDNNGNFSFTGPAIGKTLQISSIGYENYEVAITGSTRYPLQITLHSATYSVGEVEIKPKRERYVRKGNPAVDLIKELIEKKSLEDPHNNDFYSRDRYERLNVALDNFNEEKQNKSPYRRFPFLKDYVDTSAVSGKPVLNVSIRELVATDYYQKKPNRNKQHIKARNWVGIDDFMPASEIQAAVEEAVVDVDIFDNVITIFRREFQSPLAANILSQSYYKYYIMDTVSVGGEPCVDLSFVPFNSESFGFTGHLYVTADSAHLIKWAQLSVPYDINMNFVQYLNIDQKFDYDDAHNRILTEESLTTELKLYDYIDGLYVRREVFYSNYAFNDDVDKEIFDRPERIIENDNSTVMAEEYWEQERASNTGIQSKNVATMLSELRQHKGYYWTERIIMFLFSGYIPIREKEPPLYYGPLNTTLSFNELEGARLRVGGMTTAYLNPHLFTKFYLAYGTRDGRFKYMGQLEYSFKPKNESWNEFPIRSLRLLYQNDLIQYGQTFNYTNRDNIFLSIRRQADDKSAYQRLAQLTYTNEFYNGFSIEATVRNRIEQGSDLLEFEKVMPDGSYVPADKFTQTEFELKLRYAPGEKFIQRNWNRRSVTPQKPVITLTHTMAFKGFGSDFSMQRTEAEYRQRVFITPFGYFDAVIKGGKTWGQIPFQLMTIPNANLSVALRKESFELLTPMEYILDSYISWDIKYSLNGLIFNRIPLLKKLEMREVITTSGIWGTLRDCNNPAIDRSGNLFKFPDRSIAAEMGSVPYTELGIGVENILKFLRFDYYIRLTHRNTPGASNQGFRFAVHVEF